MLTRLANLGLLGWDVTGDFGGLTAYDSKRRKIVMFPRSPPLNPPTQKQEANRDRFRAVAQWWCACSAEYRTAVNLMARRANLCITGYDLATHCALTWSPGVWHTVCAQAGLFPDEPPDLRGA